jgi:hypothetical protein
MSDRDELEELTLLLAEEQFKVSIVKVNDVHHLAEILKERLLSKRTKRRRRTEQTNRRRRTEH